LEGEKWGFNLWFREDDFKKIVPYSIKNLNIPKSENKDKTDTETDEETIETKIISKFENETIETIETDEETNIISEFENDVVKIYNNVISEEDFSNFEIELGKNYFNTNISKKETIWVNNKKFPNFIKKIEKLTNESSDFFEKICFVKYPPNFVHGYHFDAFSTNSNSSKAFTEKRGQRLRTITGFITEDVSYTFRSKLHFDFKKGSLLFYNNIHNSSIDRIEQLSKSIKNNSSNSVIIFNIYVRQFDNLKKINPSCNIFNNISNDISNDISNNNIQKFENNNRIDIKNINYTEILDEIYTKFSDKTISKQGYKTIDFGSIRSNYWQKIINSVLQIKSIRTSTGILNEKYLTETYEFDEYHPIIIEDVFTKKAINLISNFYADGIINNQFKLGDRQSKRFKTRNDPYSRIIQYELLPLVEKFTKKKLRPTYTYLSCYIKGSDLPAHGDNPNCEFTVSYLLDKPKNSSWNIYFHKDKQKRHCGGRSSFTPNIDDCIACDCNKGGLMCFKGQDHLHFRDTLEYDYYNLLLLHYVAIDNTEADEQVFIEPI